MSGMRFQTSQSMKMGQHMKLAPRMIQSMEILQLSLGALEERIEEELESNVTLETFDGASPSGPDDRAKESEGPAPEKIPDVGDSDGATEGDFARLDDMESSYSEAFENEYSAARATRSELEYTPKHSASHFAGQRDGKMDAMANTAAPGASLLEQLSDQWRLADVPEDICTFGGLIIDSLDPDGYLRTDLETIADHAPEGANQPTVEQLTQALMIMQHVLEPAGVAARTVTECLLLQLDAMEQEQGAKSLADVRLLITDHLDDLTHNRLPKVATKSGLTMDQIRDAMEWMGRLSLAPGRQLVNETPQIIVPDAIVEYDEENDRYIASMIDGRVPSLRINPAYSAMSKDRGVEKKTRDFIKTNLSNANWLIDALNQRRQTLQRVLGVVLTAQREFFDFGPSALKPLPMTRVADQLGVHVATISRAVSGKHLQTPQGIIPLRKFFSGGAQTDSGEDVSWAAIKARLQEIVDSEDKAKPLSDDSLVEKLKERGIEIARRTVAKYRAQLGIPAARLRKQH